MSRRRTRASDWLTPGPACSTSIDQLSRLARPASCLAPVTFMWAPVACARNVSSRRQRSLIAGSIDPMIVHGMMQESITKPGFRRRVFLARHGEVSYFDASGRPFRPDVVPLNDEGRRQAAAVSEVLAAV